jgi:mRNA interferase MazF
MAPRRGEVWLFDLGMAANVRPVLVVSVEYGDLDRALTTVVPHTTSLRGSRFEVTVRVPFLQPGAFLAQGIVSQPSAHAIRKLGTLKPDQFAEVLLVVGQWLGLKEAAGSV